MPGVFLVAVSDMIRFSNLTLRNVLIATHDVLATAFALFATFYLRFEGDYFFDRVPLLLADPALLRRLQCGRLLCVQAHYYEMAFYFAAGALNILRVATVLTLGLLVLDYVIVSPELTALSSPARSPSSSSGSSRYSAERARFAYRYFRYTRVRRHARTEGASPALLIGRAADAEILLRGIESGAVRRIWPVGLLSPSAADRGQTIRNIPVLGGIEDIEDVIRDFERRNKPIKRMVMTPSAFAPEAHPDPF